MFPLSRLRIVLLAGATLIAGASMAQDGPSQDLVDAYANYLNARGEVTAASNQADYDEALKKLERSESHLVEVCSGLGAASVPECFENLLPSELRQPGDLDPLEPFSEAEMPAEEVVPPEPPLVEEPAPAEEEMTGPAEPQPEGEMEPPPAEEPVVEQAPAEPAPEQTAPTTEELPVEIIEPGTEDVPPEEAAPIFDSAKELLNAPEEQGPGGTGKEPMQMPIESEPATPPPSSDADAQSTAEPSQLESPTEEKGVEVTEEALPAPEAPKGAKIVNRSNFGIVFQFNNQLVIRNNDQDRMRFNQEARTLEALSGGRLREIVERQDGTTLITIYNANGDIIRRSVIDADGNEYVLVYVPDQYEQQLLDWQDPGQELPPLQLNIPAQDYVLDASRSDLATVAAFLAQPPLERVRRFYSVDEVKRSARLRDTVRRLELSDLSFQSGSASLTPDQFGSLEIVAAAMLNLLQFNPAETFLIEGHTDAVGSELSNLELSDRRAETIAIVLTEYFGVPPENLATQGFGERYLKIRTEASEPRNRRVTFKRITALVSPSPQFAG